jgi:uncharacterized protein (TIGR04255 family)
MGVPAFKNPPIEEVAIGVEFKPIRGWGIPHHGLFWERIRKQYPKFKVLGPLPSKIEQFGRGPQRPEPAFKIVEGADARCWFLQEDDSRLLQIQSDRLILNWRKVNSAEPYPRYENLKPEFQKAWADFGCFLGDVELETPEIVQCELTYVDLFPRGMGWDGYADLHRISPLLAPAPNRLGVPEAVGVTTRYALPDGRGRLHASLQQAFRTYDGSEVMKLDITARGAPMANRIEDALAWFDFGHEWAVSAFLELTTKEMHKLWGKTE